MIKLSLRERDLITTGLFMLESACRAEELHWELVDDLDGTPYDVEVRDLMTKIFEYHKDLSNEG